jgi:copper chaperone CopZ
MKKLVLEVPAMYGDHHVLEVRRILLEAPGVETVDASSAFQIVEVGFDPEKSSEEVLRQRLDEAGYLADLQVPMESGIPAVSPDTNGGTYFRHSAAYETVGNVIAFGQAVSVSGRSLWPCPGMGPVQTMDD